MLRLLGLNMMLILSGCCHKPQPNPEPGVVVIKDDDIQQLEDGSYRVTKAWFTYRMNMEQRLKEALLQCREEGI
jgi:hypothetical protein